MRKKPNLMPRMERCAHVQIRNPEEYRGQWLKEFPGYDKIHLELGCGKARFTAETAAKMPDAFIVAIEKAADAMVVGMERVSQAGLDNVRFLNNDASRLPEFFSEGEVWRIYINFCDPWPKNRDAKRRLTSPAFLMIYRSILEDNGEIHFKTDNCALFEYSLLQFAAAGFEVTEATRNLHENGPNGVMTDYESRFYDLGQKINRCIAIKKE